MAAVADRILVPGPQPRDVWLTFALSVTLHVLLTVAIVLVPRFQAGTYITVPVSYTVSLVDAPPGGRAEGGPAPAPPPAPVQATPAPQPAPAPAVRPAPAGRPTEELTLPGRHSARKPLQEREPSLRPPSVAERRNTRPVPPAPLTPVPVAPAAPAVPAPPLASVGPAVGKGGGVEVAGTGVGTGTGAGGGSALASYLTLVDWKIQTNWNPMGAPGASETVVVVHFRVLRSGQVRDLELETTSGDASLDTAALRAVRQSLPLPPFPNLLTEPFLDLRYRFVMERG